MEACGGAGGRWAPRRSGPPPPRRYGDADLQRVDASHQLKIHLVLAVDPRSAALFGPDLGLAEEMRRRGGQLGEIVVDVPGSVRPVHRVRHKLAQVIDSGHLHLAVVAEVVAFAALQRDHGLFVVQVHQVLHVVLLAPLGLLAEESCWKMALHTSE